MVGGVGAVSAIVVGIVGGVNDGAAIVVGIVAGVAKLIFP